MEDIKMIHIIAAISIVVLSIAVVFCSKCVYDLNKRINVIQKKYDSMLHYNHQTDNLLKDMIKLVNDRCDINHNLFEILNQKCELLERNKNIK